jgi:hypothetical protein
VGVEELSRERPRVVGHPRIGVVAARHEQVVEMLDRPVPERDREAAGGLGSRLHDRGPEAHEGQHAEAPGVALEVGEQLAVAGIVGRALRERMVLVLR